MKKKSLALLLSVVLVLGVVAGGSLAWLTDKTDDVKNVFAPSDINITLQEHTYDAEKDELTATVTTEGVDNYKMIPGWTIPKDPSLTVKKDSEDCWLFIKVEEKGGIVTVGETSHSFDSFIAYSIDNNNWTALDETNHPGVYYCYAKDIEADRNIKILGAGSYTYNGVAYSWKRQEVLTKPEVTKEMMNALNAYGAEKPTLIFTAYASQYWKNNDTAFTAAEAWANISGNSTAAIPDGTAQGPAAGST